jgi:PD-(D/E)XK endonuclease
MSGSAAELYVAARLVEQGYTVLWPLMTQSRYDIVIEKDGQFQSVQIKKATASRTGEFTYLQARLSSRNRNSRPKYETGEVDLFAFTDMERIWLAPFTDLEGYTSVCLGSTNPRYKPQTKYEASKWLI